MFYDIKIKNDSENSDSDISTSTDAYSIDYDKLGETIYSNTYNALSDYYEENNIQDKKNTAVVSVNNEDIPPIEFSTSTDAQLYTVSTVDAPSTVAEQVGAYTLDIRNILLIFLLIYLLITIYSKLKNTLISFYRG